MPATGAQVTFQIQVEGFKNWIITYIRQQSNWYSEVSLTNVFCLTFHVLQNWVLFITFGKKQDHLRGKLYWLRWKTICPILLPPLLKKEQLLPLTPTLKGKDGWLESAQAFMWEAGGKENTGKTHVISTSGFREQASTISGMMLSFESGTNI